MSGVKGRSGRRPNADRLWARTIEGLKEQSVPLAYQCLVDNIKNGKLEAAIYLIDRVEGRPRQEIDNRIKAQIIISPDDYELAIRQVKAAEAKLLTDYSISSPIPIEDGQLLPDVDNSELSSS